MIHDSAVTTYKNPERAPWALGSLLGNYVLSTDPRLADARTPLTHSHVVGDVTGLQTALDALTAAIALASASSGGVTDGDKGDVTVSGSGATWTIDPAAVTYAKVQDVSAISRLLGRGDSGVGSPQEITLGTNLSMSGTTLNAAAGGASTWTEAEIDFGSGVGQFDAVFTVTDGTVGATSKITVIPSGKAATGRTADDWQWDGITFAANPAAGSFALYAVAVPGPVVGKRKIQYSVAA